jgi:hypothetical protein
MRATSTIVATMHHGEAKRFARQWPGFRGLLLHTALEILRDAGPVDG